MMTNIRPRRPFADRHDAGRALAEQLATLAGRNVVVLALPRGGVPVGFEVARALRAPLDVFVVRKLGLPGQPELALGAIASGGVQVLNEVVVAAVGLPPATVDAVARVERVELERRERAYRNGRAPVPIAGRIVVIVDDGLATGATMRAAILAMRRLEPARVIVAVPVGAPQSCESLRRVADEVVCVCAPDAVSRRRPVVRRVRADQRRRGAPAAVPARPGARGGDEERLMHDAGVIAVVRRHAVPAPSTPSPGSHSDGVSAAWSPA